MSDYEKYTEKMTAEELAEERKKQAYEDFRKSVLEVAEAFFAMSEEERKAMVEYAQEKCDEAERQAKEVQLERRKARAKASCNCPECGSKLSKNFKFCPQCGHPLTDTKKD